MALLLYIKPGAPCTAVVCLARHVTHLGLPVPSASVLQAEVSGWSVAGVPSELTLTTGATRQTVLLHTDVSRLMPMLSQLTGRCNMLSTTVQVS
jgi:hypothetical protein